MATALQKEYEDIEIRIFFRANAVLCALPNQITPDCYYNLEMMFKAIINKGGEIRACGSCSYTRGIKEIGLIDGVKISTINQLAEWTVDSDRIITF